MLDTATVPPRIGMLLVLAGVSVAVCGCTDPSGGPWGGGATSHTADARQKQRAEPREPGSLEVEADLDAPISDFVRRIHQDHRGHLWFGTNGDGVARYDGDHLEFFGVGEGLGGIAVRGIVEDEDSNVWLGTDNGLTRYDGVSFSTFTDRDGLVGNDIWSLFVDRENTLWVGTLDGVSRLRAGVFTPLSLPESAPDPSRGVSSARAVHSIMEDSKGRMWFGTSGGAHIYADGSITTLTKSDGLCGNSVNAILEARDGTIWFATHYDGVCHFDGHTFTHVTEKDGVRGTEVWSLYEDGLGNLWFPVENSGVYRFDGASFTNYGEPQGLTSNAIQTIYEDREGHVWLGGWQGLFRYHEGSIVAVRRSGPWT